MSWIQSLLRLGRPERSLENPNLPLNDPDVWADVFGDVTGTESGANVTQKTANTVSAYYRGSALLSHAVAKTPLQVFRYEGNDGDKSQDRGHIAHAILHRQAGPYHSAFEFQRLLTKWAVDHGNGYALIQRDRSGDIIPAEDGGGLLPLLPDRTYPVRVGGQIKYVTSVGGVLESSQSQLVTLDSRDVLHVKGLGFDGLCGQPLIRLAAEDLGLEITQRQHGARFFQNAATPKTVIEIPTAMSDKAWQRLKTSWQAFSGKDAHKTAILEEGAEAKPLSVSAKDAQLLESRKFNAVSLANWFGLPVHMLGGEGRTAYGSLAEENQTMLDWGIDPWLCAWETECWQKLLSTSERQRETHEIQFDRTKLRRVDIAKMGEAYDKMVGGPVMRPNEARKELGLPPDPQGNEFYPPRGVAKEAPASEDNRMTALQTKVSQDVQRMAKRMLSNRLKSKEAVDSTVVTTLEPWDGILQHNKRISATTITQVAETECTRDTLDAAADAVTRAVMTAHFPEDQS